MSGNTRPAWAPRIPATPGLPRAIPAQALRVKGLEFDRVALVGLEEGVLPLDAALRATDDPPLRRAAEQRERALLYVAATRSRGEVLLSAAGRGSGWIWG